MKPLSKKLSAVAIAAVLTGCSFSNIPDKEQKAAQDSMADLLRDVPAVQQRPRAAQIERVRIPRTAPWLGDRYEASYRDEAKDAIRAVLQGRPVVFDLKNDTSPIVTSPVDASTIIGHLDAIMVQADWAYTVDAGVVIVTDTVTRQFPLHAIPGLSSGRLGLSATGAQSATMANSLDVTAAPHRDLELALRSIFAEHSNDNGQGQPTGMGGAVENAVYTIVPSANLLTVNGRPSIMRRVAQVVNDFNEAITRKVHLVITVYDVAFSSSSQRSIDFDMLREAAIMSSASFTGSSLIQTSSGGFSLGLDFFEGNELDGSSIVFNLLQQQGNTTVRLHEAFEATNNVLFSIEERRSTPYISQVSIDRQDGGSISSLTPSIETETVRTGLGFHAVATIADNSVNVRLALSQSDLVRFDPYKFGSGDSGISGTLPVTDDQDRVIPITLRDGETRLIANLTQSQFRNDQAGSGFGWLGRASSIANSEKQTVIAVTARIL